MVAAGTLALGALTLGAALLPAGTAFDVEFALAAHAHLRFLPLHQTPTFSSTRVHPSAKARRRAYPAR